MRTRFSILLLQPLLWVLPPIAQAQPAPKPTPLAAAWGDQGNGSYVNPILPGDFSDIDAIRVGDDYYAISSTLHMSPGMAVLHSHDLVNWQIIGHAVADISLLDPELNWDRMNRYGRGVWAGAIRYHAGKFWVYFCTPDDGLFVTTAENPAGPWEPPHLVWKISGYDDPCPFWDDDGQAYLVASNFARDPANGNSYNVHLFRMSADGRSLLMESDRIIHQSRGSEANKLFKVNGVYYHFYSEVKTEGRVVMMNRAATLAGPWETRQLNHVSKPIDKEPNQGGLIQLPNGQWWFLTHQGSGDWEGRALALLTVQWTDGWPIIGTPGADGIGNMVWQHAKPIPGAPILPQMDDEFDSKALAPQWEWNHQPRADKWSLTEREGFLRLHAFKPLKPGDLMKAANTLTQRSLRTGENTVIVRVDLGGMTDGQQAGLCHFAKTFCTLGISQAGNTRTLIWNDSGKITAGPTVDTPILWLKSTWDINGDCDFAYSLDGRNFIDFGGRYRLTWGSYRGDRVGVFSYNDKGGSGFVDVDWFHYSIADSQRVSP